MTDGATTGAPATLVVKPRRRWRWLRRALVVLLALVLVVGLLGWLFLPRIAEQVMRQMIAKADLERVDFQVREIGWTSAVIENVDAADGVWRLTAREVTVDYDAFDLLKGRLDRVALAGAVCVIDFQPGKVTEADEDDGLEAAPAGAGAEDAPVVHRLTGWVAQIGELNAPGAQLTVNRPGRRLKMTADLAVRSDGPEKFDATLKCPDFLMELTVATARQSTELAANLDKVAPDGFLGVLETAIDYDGSILPEGLTVGGASLRAGLRVEGSKTEPLSVAGTLHQLAYDGGTKPVRMEADRALLELSHDFAGAGRVEISGGVSSLRLPLDPSAGFVLTQKENAGAAWRASVAWGGEHTAVTAELERFALAGTYNDRPVELEDLNLKMSMLGGTMRADGAFSNHGTVIPLRYTHTLSTPGEKEHDWKLAGDLLLGPVKHTKPLPLLSAVTDVLDDVGMTGETNTEFKFTVGAYEAFRGVMTARVADASVVAADGKVRADGVNGAFTLHLIPLQDADPGQADPSYYTLDFTGKKLHIDTADALDFDLDHTGATPVKVTGKGSLGEVSKLAGEVKNLNLHGEHGGKEMDLASTTAAFNMTGDTLAAEGSFRLKENTVPFTYRHTKLTDAEKWDLAGVFEIKSAKLSNQVDNAGILVGALDGIALTGRLGLKMDFTVGSDKDFDGSLACSLAGATLTFADDGPVIEGVNGGIRLTSLKTKQTAGFHRVTATKIKAFDMEMTRPRLDFRMLPNGDIKLRNIVMRALGGTVWLDPFTLPGDDRDYRFKVRMKNLDLAQLAGLFPEFSGNIEGRIDGLLPMANINGELVPQTGGMYLTPGKRARLRYDAGNKFSGGLDPRGREYKQMKMVEESLKNLELRVLTIRLFDPRDKDKALVLRLRGQAPSVPGAPPIILNVNGFKPDDDTVGFFDLLLKHRDKLNFGL